MEKFPMTPRGMTALQTELKHLKSVERPAIIAAIAEAREHGDLSENAEYHSAREKHSFIEGRVKELEGLISLDRQGRGRLGRGPDARRHARLRNHLCRLQIAGCRTPPRSARRLARRLAQRP